MNKTVFGIFTDTENAETAINRLKSEGYNPKDISIVMKDTEAGRDLSRDTGSDVVDGTVSGVTAGALVGGLAGLLASFVIPGLGAFFIGGPIAAALGLTGAAATTASGAATGALAGGIIGALTGLGLSEDDAQVYEESIQAGGILVAVPARSGEAPDVMEILSDAGADNLRAVSVESDIRRRKSNISRHEVYQTAGMKGGKAEGYTGDDDF